MWGEPLNVNSRFLNQTRMTNYRYATLLLLCAVLLSGSPAQAAERNDSTRTPLLLRPVMAVKRLIDTMSVKGVDRRYIAPTKRPWQVLVRGNINSTIAKISSIFPIDDPVAYPHGDEYFDVELNEAPAIYTGVWAGYRGYGIGYSKNVGGDNGTYITFGATGGSFGVNLRIHRFEVETPEIHAGMYLPEWETIDTEFDLEDPINCRTLILDGYYMFNGKRFSYAAAYDQSVVQLRSAGSFMAGAMYYYMHTKYAENSNADLVLFTNDMGEVRQWQASLGAGYAYNWVPAKGWLINVMAMPMFTFVNRLRTSNFDVNFLEEEDEDGLPLLNITPKEDKITHSRIRLNFDTRLSITYQWDDRFFVNAYGQVNRFSYRQDNIHGHFIDWLAWLQLGVRL